MAWGSINFPSGALSSEIGGSARASSTAFLTLYVSRILAVLWSATAIVISLGILRQLYVYRFGYETALHELRLITLDGELTIPSWYSSTLMLIAAAVLAIHASLASSNREPTRWHWWVLTAIFVYLSADETANLHGIGNRLVRDGDYAAMFSFRWVIAAAPLLVIGGLAFLPFLRRLPYAIAWKIVLAGIIYVGGAFGLEMVGGYLSATQGFESGAYLTEVVFEEGFEMIGVTLFITVLVNYLAQQTRTLLVRVDE